MTTADRARCQTAPIERDGLERPMASDATIRRVARPRGELTEAELRNVQYFRELCDSARDEYREYVVGVLTRGASFAEVSKATGLSTNTLQRWKREASG